MAARPELDEIAVACDVRAWEALGFTVVDGVVPLGGVRIRLGAGAGAEAGGTESPAGAAARSPGRIVGWSLRGLDPDADLGGLPTGHSTAPRPSPVSHPNGAVGVDHLVALTPDFGRTLDKLRAAGLDYRRTREAGNGLRQAFFVVGPCLLELGGPAGDATRFWGLTLVVDDLDATTAMLGDRLGRVKDAVQPGRRIATVRPSAGLSVPLALMTPRR